MPSRIDEALKATVYHSPSTIPAEIIATMKADPRSNIILAKLEKYRSGKANPRSDDFWIVCTSAIRTSRGTLNRTIDFVASCTYGVVGKYPLFIYSTRREEELTEGYVDPRMHNLALEVRKVTSPRRIFSVYANEIVSRYFSKHWSICTGIRILSEPYYHAKFSYCSKNTLKRAPVPRHGYQTHIRLATEWDSQRVAELCFGFANESPPFVLTHEGSLEEARVMIRAGQVWVMEVLENNNSYIACIVCLTRNSDAVTAITKVYTSPHWRKNGFAHQLVNRVTENLLIQQSKSFVVLYVGIDNPASLVYDKVGFVGLGTEEEHPTELVELWIELGFEPSKVDLGQW